jgi:hypothetical protein
MPRDKYNTNDYIPPEYIRIYAERSIQSQAVNLYVVREDGKIGRLEFDERMDGCFSPPTLQLPDRGSEAQALMDRLWACGLRPTEGRGSAGALAATESHLSDLRTLVEKAYKVQFKKDL